MKQNECEEAQSLKDALNYCEVHGKLSPSLEKHYMSAIFSNSSTLNYCIAGEVSDNHKIVVHI
jgi:hypothetical protein